MFFFIGGIQPKTVRLDNQPITCPSCGGMSLSRMRIDSYLSLFFIPLFPVKKGIPFLKCGDCGVTYGEDGSTWRGDAASVQRKCRYCGRRIDSDFIYCPYCGKTQ